MSGGANGLLSLLANLRMFRVTKWDEDSSVTYSQEERQAATIFDANVSTSIREDCATCPEPMFGGEREQHHAVLLDLDVPTHLVPSSTPGHSHLYIDLHVPEKTYFRLLDALAEAGVIQTGYANSSKHRGGTALRLPWVKKEAIEAAEVSEEPPL